MSSENGGFSVSYKELIKIIADFIAPQGHETVLDIGCGQGLITAVIQNRARFCVGTDIAFDLLSTAQARVKHLVLADSHLPFRETSFDKVVCFHILEHLEETERDLMLNEIQRLLKPTGTLYVGLPIMEWFGKVIWFIRRHLWSNRNIVDLFGSVVHKDTFTRKKAINVLREHRFCFSGHGINNVVISNAVFPLARYAIGLILRCPVAADILYEFNKERS